MTALRPLHLQVSVSDGSLELYGCDSQGCIRRAELLPYFLVRAETGELKVQQCLNATTVGHREILVPQEMHDALRSLVKDYLKGVVIESLEDRLSLQGPLDRVSAAHAYLSVAASVLPSLAPQLHQRVAPQSRPTLAMLAMVRGGCFELQAFARDGVIRPVQLQAKLVRRDKNNDWHINALCNNLIVKPMCHVQAARSKDLIVAVDLMPKKPEVEVCIQGSIATLRAAKTAANAWSAVLEYAALLRIVLTHVQNQSFTQS